MAWGLPRQRAMVEHSSISKIICYVLLLSLVPIVLLWQVAVGVLLVRLNTKSTKGQN
ncbi:MAG: hypothetical protein ACI8XG_001895, partial [Congregibacter sp.]